MTFHEMEGPTVAKELTYSIELASEMGKRRDSPGSPHR